MNKEVTWSTIPYEGMSNSVTWSTKYLEEGNEETTPVIHVPDTKEKIFSLGQEKIIDGKKVRIPPLGILKNVFTGPEKRDVNLKSSNEWCSAAFYKSKSKTQYCMNGLFSALAPVFRMATKGANKKNGVQVARPADWTPDNGTVENHTFNPTEISIGQRSDIESHKAKYDAWKAAQDPNAENNLVLFGGSRGAATTLLAYAEYGYPEAKLMILEGCFDSTEALLEERLACNTPANDACREEKSFTASLASHACSTLFGRQQNGPEPIQAVEKMKRLAENTPAGIPIVFISSRVDKEVPYEHTRFLAESIAANKQNDVYFLTLEEADHPNYMFHNLSDREKYQTFIHAIYRKYNVPFYDEKLADLGEPLLDQALLRSNIPVPRKMVK